MHSLILKKRLQAEEAAAEDSSGMGAEESATDLEGGSEPIDWAALDSDDSLDETNPDHGFETEAEQEDAAAQEAPAEAPVPEAEAAPPQDETPAVEAQAPEQPQAVAPEQAQQPQPETQPEQPQGPSQEEIAQMRGQIHESLKNVYALSDEDAEAMLTDPQSVIPNLAANLHMTVMADVHQAIRRTVEQVTQQLPQTIQQTTQQQQESEKILNDFYGQWPELKGKEDVVTQAAAMYRQMNPDAPLEQAMNDIGRQMYVLLNIPLPGQAPAQQQAASAVPPAPAAATTVSTPSPATTNWFSAAAEEMLREEM